MGDEISVTSVHRKLDGIHTVEEIDGLWIKIRVPKVTVKEATGGVADGIIAIGDCYEHGDPGTVIDPDASDPKGLLYPACTTPSTGPGQCATTATYVGACTAPTIDGSGNIAYDQSKARKIKITFLTEQGHLPPLKVDETTLYPGLGDYSLIQQAHWSGKTLNGDTIPLKIDNIGAVKGNTERLPCSGRGLCDLTTGECTCFAGYASSNGVGEQGTLKDCGFIIPIQMRAGGGGDA